MKPISIIIPALNEQDYLPILLDSLIAQEYAGEYEVIVIDGGSSDNTQGVAKEYQKFLPNLSIHTSKRGISRQRNFGARKAQYDSLIFLDADMKITKGVLAKIEKHFQKKTNFIAAPLLFPYDGKLIDIFLGVLAYINFMVVRRSNPVVPGMCMITTKEVHERINGFNEKAVVAEDVDYGLRAYRSGARYYILFNVLVTGSARRLEKMGRLKLARTWKGWYKQTVKKGAITNASLHDYEFGKFKRN